MKEVALAIIAVTLPTLMVLVGILLNTNDTNRLGAEVSALRTAMVGEVAALRTEMVGLRNVFHGDVASLLEHDRDQDVRITRLEGN